MNWKKILTPENTEELRPGLFIQKWYDSGDKQGNYRVVNPICWKGEYRWKKQFSWKNLITIIIIAFLAWSYLTETEYARELAENPCDLLPNITSYCSERQPSLLGDNYEERNYTVIVQDYP